MTRFFFHIRTPDGRLLPDEEGVELADLDAAIREAEETARSFAMDKLLGGGDWSGCYFEVRSTGGSLNVPAFVTENA